MNIMRCSDMQGSLSWSRDVHCPHIVYNLDISTPYCNNLVCCWAVGLTTPEHMLLICANMLILGLAKLTCLGLGGKLRTSGMMPTTLCVNTDSRAGRIGVPDHAFRHHEVQKQV